MPRRRPPITASAGSPRTSADLRRRVGNPRRRVRAMLVVVFVVFTLFGAQLLRIQGFDASATQSQAATKRAGEQIIPALRGKILDAFGTVLAASYERRTVTVDQTAVTQYDPKGTPDGVAAAATRLAPLLGMPVADVTRKLTGDKQYVVVAKGITPTVWRQIQALGINGIYSEATSARTYPTGRTAAALVGFAFPESGKGATGVEQMADSALAGEPGKREFERTRYGAPIAGTETVDIPEVNGTDVRTTIDADLQFVAQNLIEAKVRDSGALAGYAVVMEVKTGRLVAVATAPTFDPEKVGSVDPSLRENRAFQEVYEPGSTGKIMTAAAAIEEGVVTPTTPVIVPNRLHRSDRSFGDHNDHGTLSLTFAGVLAKSSNIGTMLAGEQVPAPTIESYFRKFGIGSLSGAGFPGESPGLLTPAAKQSGSTRYTTLFGQGYSVTAIQAAGVYQTIANGGLRVRPRLVDGVSQADGTFVEAPHLDPIRVVSEDTATQVTSMLEEVVGPGGTAPNAAIPGYRVAGKTGTADRIVSNGKKGVYSGFTASFIGYAPAEDPRFVVAVTLQRPIHGHYGGLLCAPVFKQIMTYALQKYGVQPSSGKAAKIPLEAPGAATDPRTLKP
jgi:cell division protein FtsI (penicillin-binding protein 3)